LDPGYATFERQLSEMFSRVVQSNLASHKAMMQWKR
jgi:hypothetical protein